VDNRAAVSRHLRVKIGPDGDVFTKTISLVRIVADDSLWFPSAFGN